MSLKKRAWGEEKKGSRQVVMCLLCSKLKHLLLSSISHYSSPQKQIYQLLQISNHSLVSIIVHLLLVIYYSLFLRINVILYKLIEINKNIFKIHFLIIKNILVVPLQCLHFLPPFTFFLPSVKPPRRIRSIFHRSVESLCSKPRFQ